MNKVIIIVLLTSVLSKGYAQQKECNNCIDSITWKDNEGEKMVKIRVLMKGEMDLKNWDNRIYGTLYLKKGDSLIVLNDIKEYATSLNTIVYIKNGLMKSDFDNDGIVESYFLYEVAVDGLDDNTLKLICFYKKNKIVVLGNVPKQSERRNSIKYKTKGFENIPKSVSDKLVSLWDKEAKKRMNNYISELE